MLIFAEMLLDVADLLLNFANLVAKFAGIPPELGVVSKVVKIKCDLIFGCKNTLNFCDKLFAFWGEEREKSVEKVKKNGSGANAKTHLNGCSENAAPKGSRKVYRRKRRHGRR